MKHEQHPFCDLIGEKITSVSIADCVIEFRLVTGQLIIFAVEGDCCSESWFSDIYDIEKILNQTITTISVCDNPRTDVEDGRCRQDYDSAYGVYIDTELGRAEIVFRCSSNGYYGGWLKQCCSNEYKTEPINGEWHN